jgi:hypothetical protein
MNAASAALATETGGDGADKYIPPGYHAAAHIEHGALAAGAAEELEDFSLAEKPEGWRAKARARAKALTVVRLHPELRSPDTAAAQAQLGALHRAGKIDGAALAIAAEAVTKQEAPPTRRHSAAEAAAALKSLAGAGEANPRSISDGGGLVLTETERHLLDTEGYANLGVLLEPGQLQSIKDRLDALVLQEGGAAGAEVSQTVGVARASATMVKASCNHDGLLDVFFCHPRLLGAASHVLGKDLKLSSSNFHAPLPGGWWVHSFAVFAIDEFLGVFTACMAMFIVPGLTDGPWWVDAGMVGCRGHQGLHADIGFGVAVGDWQVCNAIWCLDEFTVELGASRVVPRSHLWSATPIELMENPDAAHPAEVSVVAAAGSCVAFNSHLWHGGTANNGNQVRRALHSFFTLGGNKQQTDMQQHLSEAVYNRLSRAQRVMLDVVDPTALVQGPSLGAKL